MSMVIGETTIHEDVFREIVRLVLEEVEGIYSYEPRNPLAPLLGDKSVKPVITVKWPEPEEEGQEQVSLEIKIAVLYGAAIPQLVAKIRQETAEQIKKFTGYDVPTVDVFITRLIRFEKERSAEENGAKTPSHHQNEEISQRGDGE
jgi:uncharacterized alkaline shock family protein YloU